MSKTIEIGPYSAYAIAVKYGYVGTEEDWIKAVEAARKSAETSAANAKREADGASTSAATATEQAGIATTKAGESAASADASASSASAAAISEANAKKYSEEAGAKANTDKTLSIENAPADAKATGDALAGKADKSTVQDESGNAIFYSKAEVEAKIKEILAAQRKKDLARIKYWASDDPTSPASFIGGTWEQIKDCFILVAGDTYAAGSTGGEAKHSLTKLENGPHSHEVVALGNDKWYYKTSNPVGIKFQTQYHTLINDISIVGTADESAGCLATNSSGTGQPHNNMPPYTATYIWRRAE